MKKSTKTRLIGRLSLFLDFITGVKFQIFCTVILMAAGVMMFRLSTRVSSPELKEYMLFVDQNTTSSRDTLTAFHMHCLIDVDGVRNNETGEKDPDVRSLIDASMCFRMHGVSYEDVRHLGNVVQTLKDKTGRAPLVFKHFKMVGMKAHGMDMGQKAFMRFPDTLSQEFQASDGDRHFYMLGRTVPHGDIHMTALSELPLLTPEDRHNPYMNAYFNFDFKKDAINITDPRSRISIETGTSRTKDGRLPYPYNFTNVWPTPDHVGPDGIEYNTIESVEKALRNGVYISAENINRKRQSDRRVFTFTLFLGVIVTMLIDNIISLIRKWKEAVHRYQG